MEENYNLSITQIKNSIKENSLVLFVGAGISANSNLPTWGELIQSLKKELNIPGERTDSPLRIAQYYYDTFGKNQYTKKIEEIFFKKGLSKPNELHKLIEKIAPKHIITTNYDSLLESQFESGLLKYNVVAEDKDIPYTSSERYLIKMHGDFSKKNIVLKEDDYLDYHLNFPMISTLIQSLIMNHTLLFVGYSLSDSTFNSIFRMIQNTFKLDAKNAYFYTPEEPSMIIREYYKKQGIFIISNEENLGQETSEKQNKLYCRTKDFLEVLSENRSQDVNNADDLWNQLAFLDRLSFIDAKDFSRYSDLKKRALNWDDEYCWFGNDQLRFEIDGHEELRIMVSKKSLLNRFLDMEIGEPRDLKGNRFLSKAFKLYEEKQYSLAKAKFRELANIAFRQKDYFNFLVCEFNFQQIQIIDRYEKTPSYAEPLYDGELSELTEQIINSVTGDEKKIIEFFRDSILNFNFLYRKLETINELFDEIREEHESYRRGGWSANNHLFNAEFTVKNLYNFLKLNCLCVEHYKIYKSIINRYLEILLLSYDNSYVNPDSSIFDRTSSWLKNLDLDDVQLILPNIDFKVVNLYFRNYSFGKIKVTEKAKDYLLNRITYLQERLEITEDENLRELKNMLIFLPLVDDIDIEKVIEILNNQTLYYNWSEEFRRIIKIVLDNMDVIDKDSLKSKIIGIVNKHLNEIFEKNFSLYNSVYPLYSQLLEYCSTDQETAIIVLEKFNTDILRIKYKNDDIKNIIEYSDLICHLFKYFEKDIKDDILDTLKVYEESENIIYHKVIDLMSYNVYDFPQIQNKIYHYLIKRINDKRVEGVKTFPDPREKSVSDLYNLSRKGYFSDFEILKDIEEDILGLYPEVDWTWFHDRSDDVIHRLLEHRTPNNIKTYFSKNEEDNKLINEYILKAFDEDKLILKK